MKVLVSGATGFIGKRLVALLRKNKYDLRLLSRANESEENIKCDLRTDTIPQSILSNISTVFHLAGFSHDINNSNKKKSHYYNLNVKATVELAKQAAKSGVKKFVFVSSVKAGGNFESGRCQDENDNNFPEGIYGETKREAELKLLAISNNSNLRVTIIRPTLVYGPNMKGNLKLMFSGIKMGWFPPLPETGNRHSMIHVDDLVRAILYISNDKKADGEIFIATDGRSYSSREIYDTMCGVLGKPISKWSIPKFLFDYCSLISPNVKYKVDKLLGNSYYSSLKLESLGFKTKKNLEDMNETDF